MEHNALLSEEKYYDYAVGYDTTNLKKTIVHSYTNYWPAIHPASLPARVLVLDIETLTYDGNNKRVARSENVYPATFSSRSDFHPSSSRTYYYVDPNNPSSDQFTRIDFQYCSSLPVRLTSFTNYTNIGTAVNTVRYQNDTNGLLHVLEVCSGVSTNPLLTMVLDYDPYTGFLQRRTDSNGDLNSNLAIDTASDYYISYTYDTYNRLTQVHLHRGGTTDELIMSNSYSPDSEPFSVMRKEYLDASVIHTSISQNDALGRAVYAWSSIGKKDTLLRYSFISKYFDLLGRVEREGYPIEVNSTDVEKAPSARSIKTPVHTVRHEHEYDAFGSEIETHVPTPFGTGDAMRSVSYWYSTTLGCTTEEVTDEEGRW